MVYLRNKRQRSSKGSTIPFIVMSVILMMGTLGIAMDLTRDFETARQLQYAAQAAALYGLSLATGSDGGYAVNTAQTNIQNAISYASTAAWNSAQSGPQNNKWSTPVTFSASDIQFVSNPLDNSEFFVQLTASRQGTDVLKQFFLPLFYTQINTALPNSVGKSSPKQLIEVLGQPASRIGPGAPLDASTTGRSADFIHFAVLPLAISNQQFATIANPSQTGTTYTIDLVASNSSEYAGSAPSGHIKGCFVNLYAANASGSGNYYGNGQGSQSLSQLLNLLKYFQMTSGSANTPPAVVERGSQLSAFDPADSSFVTQQATITQIMSALPRQFYIIPVLANDPSFSSINTVVGFARLSLDQVNVDTNTGLINSVTMDIGESVPMRNASSATGFSCIPGNTNTQIPAPVYPFSPRQLDSASNGVSIRPRGVVLAPALSPRQVKPS